LGLAAVVVVGLAVVRVLTIIHDVEVSAAAQEEEEVVVVVVLVR
jgi:hypothetical protein